MLLSADCPTVTKHVLVTAAERSIRSLGLIVVCLLAKWGDVLRAELLTVDIDSLRLGQRVLVNNCLLRSAR